MEYNKDDVITLNNNWKYIVVDKININNQNYLFLINEDDNLNNVAIVKEQVKDNICYLENIDSETEFDEIIKVLSLNHKDEVLKLLEG